MHSIRLRGPWKSEWSAGEAGTVANYTRSFHCPTGLAAGQPVCLILEAMNANDADFVHRIRAIKLNDQALPCDWERQTDEVKSIPITDLIQPVNRLQMWLAFEVSVVLEPNWELVEPRPLMDFLSVRLAIEE